MDVLDRLYYTFRIPPHASRAVRSLQKMPKAYLWDWSLVPDPAARFENMVASHLLKFCHLLQDREGHPVELRYLRDRSGREVDFLVTAGRKPWFAVEAKLSADRPDPSLTFFRERLGIPFAFQVVAEGERDFVAHEIRVVPACRFLAALA
jgi:predicted AAA+ superfamily ATPase